MVTECYRHAERAKVQALNDFLVFGTVAVLYFVLCWPLSLWGRRIESRLAAATAR